MDTIICPECGTDNPANTPYCRECGINLDFALANPTLFPEKPPKKKKPRAPKSVRMDGAVCRVMGNGNIAIQKRTALNWFTIALLAVFCAGYLILEFRVTSKGYPVDLRGLVLIGIMLGIPLFAIIVSTTKVSSVLIDVASKTVTTRQGSSVDQIPFSGFLNVFGEVRSEAMRLSKVEIKASVKAQNPTGAQSVHIAIAGYCDIIKLGSVSGAEKDAISHANTIAQLVANAIGCEFVRIAVKGSE